MSPEQYWDTASVIAGKEIFGIPLEPSEPGFLARLAQGESGQFIENLVTELFQRVPSLDGPFLDYEVNTPDGTSAKVRRSARLRGLTVA